MASASLNGKSLLVVRRSIGGRSRSPCLLRLRRTACRPTTRHTISRWSTSALFRYIGWGQQLLLVLQLGAVLFPSSSFILFTESSSQAAVRKFISYGPQQQHQQQHTTNGWLRSVPALSVQRVHSALTRLHKTTEVSTKAVSKRMKRATEQIIHNVHESSSELLSSNIGSYYGIKPSSIDGLIAGGDKTSQSASSSNSNKKLGMRDTMTLTLDELRLLRQEMEALRKEMREMQSYQQQQQQQQSPSLESLMDMEGEDAVNDNKKLLDPSMLAMQRQRSAAFDQVAADIEDWAERMLGEGEAEGWTEIKCNKMFHKSVNIDGRTQTYLKWMKDSRGTPYVDSSDDRDYPCIKMLSTIDAPLEEVCLYLSQAYRKDDYNDIIDHHKDLEEISSYSKICHGQTPQILFLKPRDLVTFCSHRWLKDGTQVVVSQAVNDSTGVIDSTKRSMAFALRGANYIRRDPNDPDKTIIYMLAHGNPGKDVPQWAIKTAVNALVPIEPFKLFHRVNTGIQNCREELEQNCRRLDDAELVSSGGISKRPGGLSQLGYACFWPYGGGIQEGGAAALRFQQNHIQLDRQSDNTTTDLSQEFEMSRRAHTPRLQDGESFEKGLIMPKPRDSLELAKDDALSDLNDSPRRPVYTK